MLRENMFDFLFFFNPCRVYIDFMQSKRFFKHPEIAKLDILTRGVCSLGSYGAYDFKKWGEGLYAPL